MSKTIASILNPVKVETFVQTKTIASFAGSQDRLQLHKAMLEAAGITSLSALGTLNLSGNLIPQAGVTKPGGNVTASTTYFQSAYKIDEGSNSVLKPYGGQATVLSATPVPSTSIRPMAGMSSQINIDTAYWAASEIHLADNTTVILRQPHRYLIIIAEKVTVGKNVTFTWERPAKPVPGQAAKPRTPDAAPMSSTLVGINGSPGQHGNKGGRGSDGHSAPEIEFWTLEMSGRPAFDLNGQDGTIGGLGQEGGNGGTGGIGKPAQLDWAGFCKTGAGAGGHGGAGGNSGIGGDGGNGGNGGRLYMYAPQEVINAYIGGFSGSFEGGRGGMGGQPGNPGAGGEGGAVGASANAKFGTSCGPGPRTAGSRGPNGSYSVPGQKGGDGVKLSEPVCISIIDREDFTIKLLEPAIFKASPSSTAAGEEITLTGKRFAKTDIVHVDDIPVKTLVYSDTSLQFALSSNIKGGTHTIQVKQNDGTFSNKTSLYVMPKVSGISQEGMDKVQPNRVRPGSKVILEGSGFAENVIVRMNGIDMPDVRLLSPSQVECTLVRPNNIQENASGERASLQIILSDGTASNSFDIVLDTFHMVVMGDSVAWGQGLLPQEKFHSLVGSMVHSRMGGIGTYKQVLAHSGAVIGKGISSNLTGWDGEVPTSFPTINHQMDLFEGQPENVDLILLDGGINDVNIRVVLNPFTNEELAPLHRQYFYEDAKALLEDLHAKFKHAKIIVTGYYPLVSEYSDLAAVEVLLVAIGAATGGIAGGVTSGFLTKTHLDIIHQRCMQLANESKFFLQQAVNEVNEQQGGGQPRVYFADPNFGPEHAALTKDPYVFGINLDFAPQDFIAAERLVSCTESGCTGIDFETCIRASMGHPNPKGAQAYADAIYPFL
ncbi:IPT/TIG domain-containing protein [Fictibacillus iocasae]|uniref:IPT/TIG domain-containing protein n=1 Tax=Fictibacillus iocasae TaxID=2715437 RepID=A0ABW2NMT9_9BACL